MARPLPPPTPGEILQSAYLSPLGMTPDDLAKAVNLPVVRIVALLGGRAGMLTDTAVRLALYFGTTDRFWVDLQSDHDLYWTRERLEFDLKEITPRSSGTAPS